MNRCKLGLFIYMLAVSCYEVLVLVQVIGNAGLCMPWSVCILRPPLNETKAPQRTVPLV